MTQTTFECSACGAPNNPSPGRAQMSCMYCGTKLTIPAVLRTETTPIAEEPLRESIQTQGSEFEPEVLLRQAQPIATRAWNAYARWTQIRYFLPTCLTLLVIGVCACGALTVLPILLRALR